MSDIQKNRLFMQCPRFGDYMSESDQQKGVPHPPHGKVATGEITALPSFDHVVLEPSYTALLDNRRSERVFTEEPLSQAQLAFLLWSAQGVQGFRGANQMATLRPVPSGGARHPFELYIAVRHVDGLAPGLYRYVPMAHVGEKRAAVEFIHGLDDYESRIKKLLAGQGWAAKAPIVLFISCVPYRGEWRYKEASHRVMLIDLGHVGQNIMLSATALGLGSCCIAAYDQALCNDALCLDGTDEYTVYAAAVGKPARN